MNDIRPSIEHPDDDPFLWLEGIDDPRAVAWVDAQSEATLARYAGPALTADRDTIRALLDRPDKIPHVRRRGGWLYNFWQDAAQARGLWRRTTLASYRSDAPAWEVLLDVDALAAAEGEDWIWGGATTLPGTHDRALLRLSRGGSDAAVLREFDLPSRRFVPDGFVLPEAKGGADWIDRDTLLLSSSFGGATDSGYPRTVRLWQRGQDPAGARILFEVDAGHMGLWGSVDRANASLVFTDQTGFFDSEVHIGGRDGAVRHLDLPSDAWKDWHRDWLVVRPRTPWTVNGRAFQPDSVMGISLSAFLAGGRDFALVFEPGPRQAMQGFFWAGDVLVLDVLDELRPRYLVVTPGSWAIAPLAGLPEIGTVGAGPLDVEPEESDGTLAASVEDPLTPPVLMHIHATRGGAQILKRMPPAFDAAGLAVSRHEAVSTDGERIPYVQVGPAEITGEAPVHMTAYGGFGISLLPHYGIVSGKLWLERGGTTVVANIRGGGEFGTRWHEAGRLRGKARSHDDFAAVAADLVARGVTRPGRIAAEGGSNGGLLIANMLTRYPERFGALFCTIPLIDMRRYSKLLAGASWIAEYGDPDVPEDWAFLRHVSAYHAAVPGQDYPPILIATSRRDDRVHPGHARKMAAKLQAMGYRAEFYEPAAGGHGYGKDNAEVAAFSALGHAFLRRAIGWEAG